VVGEVLVWEMAHGQSFYLGKGVYGPKRQGLAVLELDLVVTRATRWKGRAFTLTEHVHMFIWILWEFQAILLVFGSQSRCGKGAVGSGSGAHMMTVNELIIKTGIRLEERRKGQVPSSRMVTGSATGSARGLRVAQPWE
jgi:hypothetical protein